MLLNDPIAATAAVPVLATRENNAHWGNYLVCTNYMIHLSSATNEKSELMMRSGNSCNLQIICPQRRAIGGISRNVDFINKTNIQTKCHIFS